MSVAEQTVFLVDDDDGALKSLQYLVEAEKLRCECFASATAFLAVYDNRPGCLVADYRMPDATGLDLQQELRRRKSPLPVIVVTAYGDVATCAAAFRAGAVDFLEKPINGQILISRIRGALSRDARYREQSQRSPLTQQQLNLLTTREREALDRLVDGKSLKQIALEFGVSIQTAAKHRAKVLEKLGVANDIELVRLILLHDPPRSE